MLPPEVGVPIVRRELTAAGAGRRGRRRRRARRAARRAPPDRRPRRRRATHRGATPGRWPGGSPASTVNGGLSVVTELDPARQPFLDDHRIDGTPVLPGRDGHGGASPRPRRALLPGWQVVGARGRRARWRRSSSTATSRARSSSARWCATAATARSSPTASWSAGARCPARASSETRPLHRPRAPCARGAGGADGRRPPGRGRRAGRPRRRLPRLLPRPRLPGARSNRMLVSPDSTSNPDCALSPTGRALPVPRMVRRMRPPGGRVATR